VLPVSKWNNTYKVLSIVAQGQREHTEKEDTIIIAVIFLYFVFLAAFVVISEHPHA
jgi:hypothetical protein